MIEKQYISPSVHFETVTDEDTIRIVAGLAEIIWHEHYRAIISREQIVYMLNKYQSETAITKQVEAGIDYQLIRNPENDDPIGYYALDGNREPATAFLSKIYLLAPQRGTGIGQMMLRHIARRAHSHHKANRIVLVVNKRNHLAHRAYERAGYRRVGDLVANIGNGFVMDDYVYECQLSNV